MYRPSDTLSVVHFYLPKQVKMEISGASGFAKRKQNGVLQQVARRRIPFLGSIA